MSLTEIIQFQAKPELRRQIETRATKLKLSVPTYALYLHKRANPREEPARLDRHVRKVFGKHGDLMRELAK